MSSSIVSFSKIPLNEEIPGLQAGRFFIEPAENHIPNILHITDSYYYKPDLDGNQDTVFVPSSQIAQSLVHMHITSQLAYRVDQHPAIFAVPDAELTISDIQKSYAQVVKQALAKQRQWFLALVQIADDDWQQAHRHRMISGIQRIAARELGLKRDWLIEIADEAEEKAACPFCGTGLLDANAPICPSCGKVHNPARMAELEAKLNGKSNPVTGK